MAGEEEGRDAPRLLSSSHLPLARGTPLSLDYSMTPSSTYPPSSAALPIIDLSPFLLPSSSSSSSARASTASAIHSACTQFGFFYLTGIDSVISSKDFTTSLATARAFFGQPEEEKERIAIKGARGWQRLGQNVTQYLSDHHEGLDLYRPMRPEEEDPESLLFGPNQWPTQPPDFRAVMEGWIEKCQVVGMALMEATAMGLGMDVQGEEWASLKELVAESFWVMRVSTYRIRKGFRADQRVSTVYRIPSTSLRRPRSLLRRSQRCADPLSLPFPSPLHPANDPLASQTTAATPSCTPIPLQEHSKSSTNPQSAAQWKVPPEGNGSTPIPSLGRSCATWGRCGRFGQRGCTRLRCIGSFIRERIIVSRECACAELSPV